MLQANSHTFPSNVWIHRITKRKESDRCDLWKSLWITQGRFQSEKDLPEQTLGHIQHTWEVLSTAHIDAHHQCWRLIHGELARLTVPEWKFLCISGEKCLQTLWNDIPTEIQDLDYLNLTQDSIWNNARDREMQRPLLQAEEKKIQECQSRETVAKKRFWRLRPDGITVLLPAGNKTVFCILETRPSSAFREGFARHFVSFGLWYKHFKLVLIWYKKTRELSGFPKVSRRFRETDFFFRGPFF